MKIEDDDDDDVWLNQMWLGSRGDKATKLGNSHDNSSTNIFRFFECVHHGTNPQIPENNQIFGSRMSNLCR